MTYFYDYFARQYREGRNGSLLPAPAAIFGNIEPEDVRNCRLVLKNAYANYRMGRNGSVEAADRGVPGICFLLP